MTTAPSRKGFTLVELLVVTGLLASLLSLVIVAMRPTEDTQIRQAANALASAIMQTQTRALSKTQGAALAIYPSGTSVDFCDCDPPIIATSTTAIPPAATSANIVFTRPSNADAVSDGYQIRFSAGGPYGPWFRLEPAKNGDLVGVVSMRADLGQTTATAVWPAITSGSAIGCEISRMPRASQAAFTFPKNVRLETRYSGVGEEVNVNIKPAPLLLSVNTLGGIYLHFDRTGALSTIIPGNGSNPIKPTKPVYLLIAGASQVSTDSALQSQTATWVAVLPGVTRVLTGKNTPQSKPDDSALGNEQLAPYYRDYYGVARSNVVPYTPPPK